MIDTNNPDLDAVLDALTVTDNTTKDSAIPKQSEKEYTDDEIYQFSINKLRESIDSNAIAMEQSKDLMYQIGTPEYIEAHAAMVKGHTELIKTMMAASIEKKKLQQAKELKTRDLDIKEKGIAGKQNPQLENSPHATHYIIATRDSIFDSLFGTKEDKDKAEIKIKEANGIIVDV